MRRAARVLGHLRPRAEDLKLNDLPIDPSFPPQSAWGVWGPEDQLGTVNLLTPERVAQAARLVQTGKVFPLNWDLELPEPPLFGRTRLAHTIHFKRNFVHDDIYNDFNTQSSSQWDGLTHYGHSKYQWYNGTTKEQITGKPGTKLGMEHLARRGIAGRVVLLDIPRWKAAKGAPYVPNTATYIEAEELEECAKAQGVQFQVGDILLVRTGWLEWYKNASMEQRTRLAEGGRAGYAWAGVGQGEAMKQFLWNNHFAAVCSDNPSFEAFPPRADFMHETIIGLWGMIIGEYFDCDALAEDCARDGRYAAFFTSAPLNKLGGVASPPNALVLK